jgi:hypothetical protein
MKTGKGAWSVLHNCQDCEVFLRQHQTQIEVFKMENKELQKYIAAQKENLDKQRHDAMEKKGYKDFYTFEEGETAFILHPVIPREKQGMYGLQSVFRISVEGHEYDFSVNQKSPVFRQLIELMDNMTDALKLRITRVGVGKATKMTVLTPKKTKKV